MKFKTYLDDLEAESIFILREVAASFEHPVLLYSVGKDSSVMAHLAKKAFYPAKIPFPFLHVDTGFKFKEMYTFRDSFVRQLGGVELLIYKNDITKNNITKNDIIKNEVNKNQSGQFQSGHSRNAYQQLNITSNQNTNIEINPYDLGTQKCCDILKTKALLGALSYWNIDAAIGGARRDEERSRAKERIFSFRDTHGQWDPKNQRPELWNLYNTKVNPGESIRVFPISNWTELSIWTYIKQEQIPVVPLYFAKQRQVVIRKDQLIPIEDGSRISKNEVPQFVNCRFRTLGCVPCTGAIRSDADTIDAIIKEMTEVKISERSTRLIDHDVDASMENKKREGYF